MITLEEVIENELVSKEILDIIPHQCECGAPIAFTDTLVNIACTNPRCYYKVASRLEAMAKKLRGKNGEVCDGWGESACIAVCKDYKLVSPYQIFQFEKLIGKGIKNDIPAFEKKIKSICNPELRKQELWKVVELAGIPNIDSIAYKIFGGYHSIQEAYDDIEKWQVPFIANKLGIKSADTSVMAVNIYNTLIEYKDELLYGEKQFEIYEPTGETLYIAITGGVGGFKNKSEFINYINKRYDGKVNAMLMNSVTNSVDILVVDGFSNSNKFKTANRLNNTYLEKGLKNGEFTPDEVGTYKNEKDLHAIGEKIFMGNAEETIARLDKVYG